MQFVGIGEHEFEIAAEAYAQYGKGRQPAANQSGKASVQGFKGEEFTKTDPVCWVGGIASAIHCLTDVATTFSRSQLHWYCGATAIGSFASGTQNLGRVATAAALVPAVTQAALRERRDAASALATSEPTPSGPTRRFPPPPREAVLKLRPQPVSA